MSNKVLLQLYQRLLSPRLIEEKMLILLRQGQISKWFSGIGQEAIAVGTINARRENDHIITAYRDHGHALTVGSDTKKVMA